MKLRLGFRGLLSELIRRLLKPWLPNSALIWRVAMPAPPNIVQNSGIGVLFAVAIFFWPIFTAFSNAMDM
jgi:hypothetical protein